MRIFVKVKAGARQEKLQKLDESHFTALERRRFPPAEHVVPVLTGFAAAVLAPPEKGNANRAVRKLLATHFHLPVAQVRIISGAASKNKVIEVLY